MCQLLGLNAARPTDIMFSFTGLARRADEHKDGFGIAFFEERGLRSFVDAQSARHSAVAELVQRYPIRSTHILAHIRKATQGRVALENTHPFVRELWGRYWVFAHNGNLPDFQPRLHATFRPVGDTDSERAFCWLMQELAKAHAGLPELPELTATLRELSVPLAAMGSFNYLLSNGEALWAHGSTKLSYWLRGDEAAQQLQSQTVRDGDMLLNFNPAVQSEAPQRLAVIATEPITQDPAWTAFAPGQLIAFVGGQPMPY